jgi:putative heme-binding domain-containing protein
MAADLKPLIEQLTGKLKDASLPDEQRAQVVASLLAVRQMNPDILPSVASLFGSGSPALQRQLIEALGGVADVGVGALLVDAYGKVAAELHDAIFAQLIKRSDWALALIEALKNGKIPIGTLGPVALNRLRTHSDKAVARRANSVLDELRGPEVKEKNDLIARFTPEVEKSGGNVENGHKLFSQNCATCHSFKGEGKDVAPDLTGMGAKGVEELLIHVLDPNRYVEPNFFSFSVETKDGESFDGIISRENNAGVVLRNASGDVEIKTENIKSRRNTGLSLMPNGFEALGGEGLRDLLTYICADENRYRMLDLKDAFTTSTTRGIYAGADLLEDTLRFKKFGIVRGGEVPFEVVSPARTAAGNNLIVLKGGSGVAKTMPQKVEIERVGVRASRLHFLGGVGGWAWPCCGDDKHEKMPVAKVTVNFADGQAEEIVLKNGVEFVDWIDANDEVPGSKEISGLLRRGQVRWFSKPLQHRGVIQKITLESFDNAVAPTFVAVTAEVGEATQAAAAHQGTDSGTGAAGGEVGSDSGLKWGDGRKVLIVGGGTSHDFNRWFNQADKALLSAAGKTSVNYTDRPAAILPVLKDLDVLYLSSNQPMPDRALRQGIFDFAQAGKGLLLVHPALWFNWKDWPEYNRVLVGGGARSHDKFEEFEVTVDETTHPIMAGVPAQFKITDELYHFQRDEEGTPLQVLATGKSPLTGKVFPVVWVVKHPNARIACVTLGHDGKAHEHPAFKAILQNSLTWAAAK